MEKDTYLIELLKSAKDTYHTSEQQQASAGRGLMAYLSGRVWSDAEAGDPVAARLRVQVYRMLPHLINSEV